MLVFWRVSFRAEFPQFWFGFSLAHPVGVALDIMYFFPLVFFNICLRWSEMPCFECRPQIATIAVQIRPICIFPGRVENAFADLKHHTSIHGMLIIRVSRHHNGRYSKIFLLASVGCVGICSIVFYCTFVPFIFMPPIMKCGLLLFDANHTS